MYLGYLNQQSFVLVRQPLYFLVLIHLKQYNGAFRPLAIQKCHSFIICTPKQPCCTTFVKIVLFLADLDYIGFGTVHRRGDLPVGVAIGSHSLYLLLVKLWRSATLTLLFKFDIHALTVWHIPDTLNGQPQSQFPFQFLICALIPVNTNLTHAYAPFQAQYRVPLCKYRPR